MARYKKGESGSPEKRISAEIAQEYQRRSVKSRLANKQGQELVRAMLQEGVQDPIVLEALKRAGFNIKKASNELAMHARQIEKAQKTGDTKAYNAVMKAAGYDTLNVKTDGPAIVPMTPEAIEALSKWSKGE